MKIASIAMVLLSGTMLLSGLACGTTEWQLTTIVDGQGEISPSSGAFDDAEVVTLTALPESGSDFDHWGGQASGTENPITITMDSDKTIYAYFTLEPTPTPMPTPIAGYQTYNDEDNGFSISFPEDWLVGHTEEWFLWVGSSCAGEPIIVAVTQYDYSPTDSLQTYFYDYLLPFWSDVEGYTSISIEDISLNGVPAIKHIFTEIEAADGYTIKHISIAAVNERECWHIMINISPECWNSYKDRLNTITDSFRFLD